MTALPKITNKQKQILKLIYRHRFLNRIQIQEFMGHKDYKTINLWLKDLSEKKYLGRKYSTHFAERTKPAIYYLGLNGVRLLRIKGVYPEGELRKRYRDVNRKETFIESCLMIADCCLSMLRRKDNKSYYYYETEADYILSGGYYNFLIEGEMIRPDLCFSKEVYDEEEQKYLTHTDYLLEVFDAKMPRYRIKKRLSNYLEWLESGEWEVETDANELPTILMVCPSLRDMIYAKRRTRGLLNETWDYEDEERPVFYFATVDIFNDGSLFAQGAWEQA